MGSLHAIKRDFDLVGVTVVALCSGPVAAPPRDVLINRPVLALQREELLVAALCACGTGMVLGHPCPPSPAHHLGGRSDLARPLHRDAGSSAPRKWA